jgi:hypothetical protein
MLEVMSTLSRNLPILLVNLRKSILNQTFRKYRFDTRNAVRYKQTKVTIGHRADLQKTAKEYAEYLRAQTNLKIFLIMRKCHGRFNVAETIEQFIITFVIQYQIIFLFH